MADAPEFPTGADASVVADWAELFVCVTGEGVTRGRLVQAVAREGAEQTSLSLKMRGRF